MFESVELGQKIDKATFKERRPQLREALLRAQFRLSESRKALIIVVAGVEGAGKGDTVNLLLEWLDSRGIVTHAPSEQTARESERPELYRFWKRLPPKGRAAIFFGSWYTKPIVDRVFGKTTEAQLESQTRRIVEFERMLEAEGNIIVKLWFHITKKQQRQRLQKLSGDPMTAWRVSNKDWEYHATYDEFTVVAAKTIQHTDAGHAPWHLIEAGNARFRNLKAAETVLDALNRRLPRYHDPKPDPAPTEAEPGPSGVEMDGDEATTAALRPTASEVNLINSLDLSQRLSRSDYEKKLRDYQGKIGRLARRLSASKHSLMMVFEGSDAAGKGGSIRRIVHALDARYYRVVPIAAPTDEELARPYLWRFWRNLPRRGHVSIFDRSWYGRVLVERIEGLSDRSAWQRAFAEINQFEEQLTEAGILVIKFWLAISQEEQLKRFEDREKTAYKGYKLTTEDWRNREKWPAYEAAACEMIERTSSEGAAWTLVEAEDKRHARIKVLRTVCTSLEGVLGKDLVPVGHKSGRSKKDAQS